MREKLLEQLNLEEGYYISDISYDGETDSFIVDIDAVIKEAPCPMCNNASKIHDRLQKKWRHTDYENSKVYITFRNPRIKCVDHGVKTSDVNWAKPKHRFTIELEELVCKLAEDKSFLQIAKELDEHDTRIRRVVKRSEDEKIIND
ncbi:helix-turn-helix domain-containing protein [Mollicutes bacterium LVI A0078]|nr:helix-turn-helix domain-containing protein [Mollicutes bacterium LVI A0075]WOO91814.1 helix-turn-helix domain-containing protein [Mollicutes bacterium LVI A0078]